MKHTKTLFDLTDRVAIVTGGKGNYGSSISTALCEMGATVVVASRDVVKCQEFAASLQEQGYRAVGMKLDLAEDDSIQELVSAVYKQYGCIDILVNNAYFFDKRPFPTVTREELQNTNNINMSGVMILTQAVVKHMQAQGGGSIVNISSTRGIDCPHFPFYPETWGEQGVNYTTEKWAMVGLTKFLAGRYGKDNIRVNCICPGGNDPSLINNPDKCEFVETYSKHCPLGRWANEDDIKGPAVFLASEAASYVNGATLVMDGGWTIW